MNLMAPDVITLVDTVTMAQRAAIVPLAVSTATALRASIDVTGVDSLTAIPSAKEAMSAPNPWWQNAAVLRSAALAKSTADTCVRSLAQANGPSWNSIEGRQSPRS